ncbi:hypothetical protein RRF57_007551 [Xylaria bambusicola]|uniref:Very-long-chain (3R)-3-hydroxyacyl-CoA dehydratase n=1 Tax=Xylaria bambusicola TaxID=326684 RepID=A0AAN7Z7M3_9PEZI
MADKPTQKPPRKPSPVKNGYLILYNAVSAMLWLTVLGRIVGVNALRGPRLAYPPWANSASGRRHSRAWKYCTRFCRYAIVWGITDLFPQLGASPAYSSMLVAWSVTEVIRYSYFALTLSGWQPSVLHWMRYHAFFILYPLGISSEAWLIWRAVEPAKNVHPLYSTALWAYVVFVYPPSAYILYTHMMTQRRKFSKRLTQRLRNKRQSLKIW